MAKGSDQLLTLRAFLSESNRLEFLHKLFRPKFAGMPNEKYDEMFQKVTAHDPSRNHQYLQWMMNMLVSKSAQMSDLDKMKEDLVIFDRVKQRVPQERRDINRYKQYQDLYDVVKEFGDSKSNKEVKRDEIAEWKSQITTVYDGPEGKIYVPHTMESSQFLGRATRWCTAATGSSNYFKSYNDRGDLIIFIAKDGSKFQFHAVRVGDLHHAYQNEPADFIRAMSGGEFRDSADRLVGEQMFNQYAKLFLRVAHHPKYKYAFLPFALEHKNVALFHEIKGQYKGLLDEFYEDAPDLIEFAKKGGLRSGDLQKIATYAEFVYKNYKH